MASLLIPREAGLRLGFSYPTIKQWIYQGKIRTAQTPDTQKREMLLEVTETVAALIKSTEVIVRRV